MMKLCVGMIYSQRMLIRGNVVSQYQIKLKIFSPLAGNGSDRIVRFSVCLRINKCIFIRIASLLVKDPVCQFNDPVCLCCP